MGERRASPGRAKIQRLGAAAIAATLGSTRSSSCNCTVGATTATQAQTNSRIAETVTFRDSVEGPWQAKPDTMLGSRTNERYFTETGTGRRNLARVRGSSLGTYSRSSAESRFCSTARDWRGRAVQKRH